MFKYSVTMETIIFIRNALRMSFVNTPMFPLIKNC